MTAGTTPTPASREPSEPPEPTHPGRLALLTGMLLAPFAWIAQTVIAETLAAQSCYPFNHPLSSPAVTWMQPALVVLSALCLAAAVFGGFTAWRTIRQIGPARWGSLQGAHRTRAELEWFLSRVAAMCSALFLFALIATDIALAIVSPCKW